MVQPINYGAVFQGQESPADAFEQAFKSATGIRQIMDAREAAQRQAEAQAAMQQELASVANNPNATAADYSRLMTKYPALSENLKRSWDTLSAGQQKSGLATLSKASAAFTAGKPDVVIRLLKSESEALRNAGDTANADLYDSLARATEIDPLFGKNMAFSMLAGVPGGDKVIDGLGKVGAEARAQELQPIAVRRQTAEAEGAEAEATTKGVDAKYAEQAKIASLQKLAADTGLTKAQTNQAIALTKKYNQETAAAVVAAATGNPAAKFDAENRLRKEYTDQTKPFVDVTEGFRRVKSAKPDAVGDLSLIFGYMKMLDPGSVVREGEFATAQNARGVPDSIRNMYNKVMNGERLNDQQRISFKDQAGKLYEAAQKREGEVRTGLEKVAKTYGLNTENIFATRTQEESTATTETAPTATNPKTGEKLVLRDGKWVPLK